jgi:hypothetical protein
MQPQYIVFYADESGRSKVVPILKPQFNIGRGSDNDLVINNPKLSRRHAVIEIIGSSPYLSDNGSQNGTYVNEKLVSAPARLASGDIINLGGACDLGFGIESPGKAQTASAPAAMEVEAPEAGSNSPTLNEAPSTNAAPSISSAPSSKVPIVAGAAIGVILVCAVLLIAISHSSGSRQPDEANLSTLQDPTYPTSSPMSSPGPTTAETGGTPRAAESSTPINADGKASVSSDAEIGRAAQRVMERISKDTSPYISDQGKRDVAAKIREYRGSTALAAKFRSMSQRCTEVTELAQANSLKPSLLSFAAIAQSEGGGDPLGTARQMAPRLLTLRATFGTDTANSTLLLLAAYPYPFNPQIGSQTRTAHPLASKLVELGGRRSVEDTSVARSVWFLREKNGLMPEAYDLVIRFLAIGVIAQDPHAYGVDADPLFC